jgi:dolichyl-phosphate-mannose-protein mannosyltransferase
MYGYHKNLVSTHPFSSKWWQWPIMTKPLWAYSGTDVTPGKTSTITILGNPAIWWIGIIAIISSIFIAVKKHDRKIVVVLVAIAAQYLPWVLIPRIAFIYHFFSIVPFAILAIVYVIKNIEEKYPKARYMVYVYLTVVALLFIWFYPVLSGMEVDSSYIANLRWLKSWIF